MKVTLQKLLIRETINTVKTVKKKIQAENVFGQTPTFMQTNNSHIIICKETDMKNDSSKRN